MMELILIIVIIVFVVLVGLLLKELHNNKVQNQQNLQMMQEQLNQFQNNVVNNVRSDMNMLNENTSDRFFKMEHVVNEQLNQGLKTTSDAFSKMMQQVVKIDKNQEQLQNLSADISNLNKIFTDKKTRGVYGEIELYSLLEASFGNNHQLYAKQYKLADNKIVDAVIFGNSQLGVIPIDSKFPLENFQRLEDPQYSNDEKRKFVTAFKNDLKKHIDDISSKYIIPGTTSEFALMFIPAEAIFNYICTNLDDIINYSYQKKVFLVSPTNLMAYVTSIKALYLDQQKNEQVQELQAALIKLGVEFNRFKTRYEKVLKDSNNLTNDLNQLMVTAEKLHKQFIKIEEVDIQDNNEEE